MTNAYAAAHRTRPRRARRTVAGLTTLPLALIATVISAGTAQAEPECLHPGYDFDADGTVDPVIGSPGGEGVGGRVEVRVSNDGAPVTARISGPTGFGTAVAQAASYENEGDDRFCSTLLVGSPLETVDGVPRAGAVHNYVWDSEQQRFLSRGRYAPGDGLAGKPQAGARFGSAIGAEARPAEEIDPVPTRIWVGAPRQDLGGRTDAGRVYSFMLGAEDHPAAEDPEVLDLSSAGVPGDPATGARFGAAISVADSVVAIGAPGQPAVGVSGAGAVLIAADRELNPFSPRLFSQASDGFPGTAETGDRLGAAVHVGRVPDSRRVDVLVGAPGEDLGSTTDAGTVDVLPVSTETGQPVGTIRGWDQDSAQMAGRAEAGDRFGTSVGSVPTTERRLLAGTPGEDIGSTADAGMVQVVGGPGGWSQATAGIPGSPEAGDRMGAALAEHLVGVPGENDGTGAVISGLPIDGGTAVRWSGPGPAGAQYGAALAP